MAVFTKHLTVASQGKCLKCMDGSLPWCILQYNRKKLLAPSANEDCYEIRLY